MRRGVSGLSLRPRCRGPTCVRSARSEGSAQRGGPARVKFPPPTHTPGNAPPAPPSCDPQGVRSVPVHPVDSESARGDAELLGRCAHRRATAAYALQGARRLSPSAFDRPARALIRHAMKAFVLLMQRQARQSARVFVQNRRHAARQGSRLRRSMWACASERSGPSVSVARARAHTLARPHARRTSSSRMLVSPSISTPFPALAIKASSSHLASHDHVSAASASLASALPARVGATATASAPLARAPRSAGAKSWSWLTTTTAPPAPCASAKAPMCARMSVSAAWGLVGTSCTSTPADDRAARKAGRRPSERPLAYTAKMAGTPSRF